MRVEAFIPVVALMALQGASAAPVNQNQEQFEKRWCLLGFIGTSCGGFSNAVTTSSAVAKASSTSAAPVASSAKASSSASSPAAASKITSSSAVAAKSATTTITTAAATSTAAWSSCKDFDWTAFNGWSWGGYGIDYVKAWYLDVYGLNPPANMNWHQVSALVSSFGQKTVAAGPKATSSYHRGCSNPWTSKTGPASTTVVVSTSTAPAATSKAASSSNAASAVASASASASKSSAVVSSSAAASASTSKSSAAAASSVVASSAAVTSVAAAPAATSSAAVSSASASSSAAAVSASPAVASSASSASSAVSAAGTTVASVTSSAAAQATDAATTVAGGSATGVPGTGSGSNNATGTASSAASAATTSAAVVINGYESGGCVQEVSGRLLSKVQTSSSNMTVEQCTSLCMSYGFGVAGVEYGNECYCGVTDDLANTAVSGQCYMPCAGDSTETCGGPNALNIYVNEDIQPATTVLPTGWTTYGVVSEGTNGRALTYTLWSKNDNTVESCAQGCAAAGYSIAGTEYSSECYCGNSFSNGGGAIQDSSAAFMACSGNLAEMCGGPSILSVVTSLSGTIPSN
ncbi:hypothetical protein I316_04532 [Kwoniella heveanensis BCC8398]|uniref:WSC domain-containing protein n=1 Tax=Kwoniella heveanensis BCC8398 TaxID=1296120 RepID=A0A1B9GRW9_9TREE|nr:hypothetical protein I316_04532 [Kwoniella heveanensis BCC8398]